jgi:tetratricopeptide (TPR) repeat protein
MTRVEYESHHFGAARDLALQLAKLDPNKSRSFALLGDGCLELGAVNGAIDAYREMQRLNGPAIEAEPRLARLALARGRLDEAAEHSAKAVQAARDLSPERPDLVAWSLVQLGQLSFDRGNWSAAEGHYKAALQADPENPHALEHLGELSAALEKYDEAISLDERAIGLAPRPEFVQALGDICAAAGRRDEAADYHHRSRDAFLKNAEENNAHYFHHLAGYYCDVEENAAEALKWARRDLELRQTAAAHDALAWALYRAGEMSAAVEQARAALQTGTQNAHILFHAGMIFLAAGETARGRELLADAARVNPRHMAFHVHR